MAETPTVTAWHDPSRQLPNVRHGALGSVVQLAVVLAEPVADGGPVIRQATFDGPLKGFFDAATGMRLEGVLLWSYKPGAVPKAEHEYLDVLRELRAGYGDHPGQFSLERAALDAAIDLLTFVPAAAPDVQCRTCALMPSRPDILFQSLISCVQSFVAREDAGDGAAAQEWRRQIQLYAQALAGIDHAAPPPSPWKSIHELPNSDDLFWFMRWDDAAHTSYTVDGPRAPQFGGFDADEWTYFAPAVSPSVRTVSASPTLAQRVAEHQASGDGFTVIPELRIAGGKSSLGLTAADLIPGEMSKAEIERRLAFAVGGEPAHTLPHDEGLTLDDPSLEPVGFDERAAVPETDTPVEAVYPVPENAEESESLEPGPWMSGDLKPVRDGHYLRHFDDQDDEAYSEWRNGAWYAGDFFSPRSDIQNAPWRGGVLFEGKTHADWVREHGDADDA